MPLPIKLISTDFDGTLFAEFENPPIPENLQQIIGDLQAQGAKWVINTGRDMSSLMEALGRAGIAIEPDCLVLVEREIYRHQDSRYLGLEDWNSACACAHAEIFARVAADLPDIVAWINARFHARIYEDAYSPFCLIAGNNGDADVIHDYLADYCRNVPHLTVVRNDVYARFSHAAYNKGTALAELSRRLGNCWVVLKGHQTLIGRSAGEILVNSSGNPCLAQGGSGDVLAGYLGGLLAQLALQADPLRTLRYGVWQHGAAADRLNDKRQGWTVEDLMEELGR